MPLLRAFAADAQQRAASIAEGVVLGGDLRPLDDCVGECHEVHLLLAREVYRACRMRLSKQGVLARTRIP